MASARFKPAIPSIKKCIEVGAGMPADACLCSMGWAAVH